jgi:effector-binding domain-containing protein
MGDDVQIKQLPAQLALVVTKRVKMGEVAQGMGEAFGTLMRHAGATGARFAGPPFCLYPEMPADEFTFLVCMPVAPGAVAGDDVKLDELPAVEAATLLYRGPYAGMEPSWRRLMEWVGASGRQPWGATREIYLSDPDTTAPEDLLTELVVPLA